MTLLPILLPSFFLFKGRGERAYRIPLDWETRLGAARGIALIHTRTIGNFFFTPATSRPQMFHKQAFIRLHLRPRIGVTDEANQCQVPFSRVLRTRGHTDTRKASQCSDVRMYTAAVSPYLELRIGTELICCTLSPFVEWLLTTSR